MIWGALIALWLYLLTDILRARRRYLQHQRWSEERRALHDLRRIR